MSLNILHLMYCGEIDLYVHNGPACLAWSPFLHMIHESLFFIIYFKKKIKDVTVITLLQSYASTIV